MIRKFQREDLNRVAEIWLETNIKAHGFIPAQYWRGNFDAVKAMFLQAEIYVYKEEAAGEIQGFIGLSGDYIAGIFVCGEAQSKGIGKQLLDFAKESRRELRLSVYEKNIRAAAFYRREGFAVESRAVDENTGENERRMVWRR